MNITLPSDQLVCSNCPRTLTFLYGVPEVSLWRCHGCASLFWAFHGVMGNA